MTCFLNKPNWIKITFTNRCLIHFGEAINSKILNTFPDENTFVSSTDSTSCTASYYRQIIWIIRLFWLIEIRFLLWIEPIILIDFLFNITICPEAFIFNDVETGISMNIVNNKRFVGSVFDYFFTFDFGCIFSEALRDDHNLETEAFFK